MRLSFYIAIRYFFSKRKKGGFNAISLISFISILAYTVGAASLIIVLSVFNGFEALFIKMYSNFDADLRVMPKNGKHIRIDSIPIKNITNNPGVKGVSWVYEENALLRYNNKQTIATVKAVDEKYPKLNPLDSNLLKGLLLLQENDTFYAWVGQGIGYQLGVDPDNQFNYLGIYLPQKGKVDLLNPESAFAHGIIFPLAVFGIQEEVDNKYIIVPLKYIQKLLDDSVNVSALEIRLEPNSDIERSREILQKTLGSNLIIKTRFEQRESFFKVMQSEKSISYIILVFILLIAAFNTIGSLYMMVIEKEQDLFVLSSMGLKQTQAALIYGIQSVMVAITGGIIGLTIGAFIAWGQEKYKWLSIQNSENIALNGYPILLKWEDIFSVLLTIVLMGIVTSAIPAMKAYKLISPQK